MTCTPEETGVFTDYFNRGMRIWNHFASTLEKPCGILWPVFLGCENWIADLWTTPLQHNIGSLSYLGDSTELPRGSLESYPNFPHNLEGLGPSHGDLGVGVEPDTAEVERRKKHLLNLSTVVHPELVSTFCARAWRFSNGQRLTVAFWFCLYERVSLCIPD